MLDLFDTLLNAFLWLLRFLIGACVFSFVNVVAYRLPRGECVVVGRSRCPACGRSLGPLELVPCLSYLLLHRRCKGCGTKLPARDFFVELLGGMLALCCRLRWGGARAEAALGLAVLALLTSVALIDHDTHLIYDRFHVLLLLCGLLSLWVFPETGSRARGIGCVVVSVPMLLAALLIPGGFGGGDIKLCFALGFLLGWRGMLCAIFFGICGAGLYCIYQLTRKRTGWKDQLAFAPFLCTGAALALFFGDEIVDWWLGLSI